VHKVADFFGLGVGAQQSEIESAMDKLGKWVHKGGEYLDKKTGGRIVAGDVDDLVNALMARGGVEGLRMAGRIVGIKPKVSAPKEVAIVREEPTLEQASVHPDESPTSAATKHVTQTTTAATGMKAALLNKGVLAARKAYAEDSDFHKYVESRAEAEAQAPTDIERQVEAQAVKDAAEGKIEQVSDSDAYKIMGKSQAQRSLMDTYRLQQWNKQAGKADPATLAKLAAVGIGATVGMNLDPDGKTEGALIGAILAGTVVGVGGKAGATYRAVKDIFKPDTRIRIDDLGDHWDASIAKAGRQTFLVQDAVHKLVPLAADREKITHWLQGDKTIPLTNSEYGAAKIIRSYYDELGQAGLKAGVLEDLVPDYVTGLWQLDGKNAKTWTSMTANMSTKSKYDLMKKIQTYKQGIALGLKPRTLDPMEIMGIYGNSLARTMANKQLLDTLKTQQVPGTKNALVMGMQKAPHDYVTIQHPSLTGLKVHPDIAPSMRFMYDQVSPRGWMAGLDNISMALKRNAVSASLFHAKALLDAFEGAGLANIRHVPGILRGTNQYLRQLKDSGNAPLIDAAHEGGLKFSYDTRSLGIEDIGQDGFYQSLKGVQDVMDNVFQGLGKPMEKYIQLNHAVDHIMWDRLHTGMKLQTFANMREKLIENNINRAKADPKYTLKSNQAINKMAASYTNDLFGGLNWRQVAESFKTQWGRDLALQVMSPSGRRVMRIAMFAPDWTISTTRAAAGALGKGSGLKGLIKPTELADLHRQYLIRSAAYYFVVGNALNIAWSGHPIWQNDDPSYLDYGDGRKVQFSKHAMEPYHWITNPAQQAMNKMGILPKEALTQLEGKEYLSTKGAPPMDTSAGGRAMHVLKNLVPINIQQGGRSVFDDPGSALMGEVGMPVYGMTEDQKEAARESSAEKRRRKQEEKDEEDSE